MISFARKSTEITAVDQIKPAASVNESVINNNKRNIKHPMIDKNITKLGSYLDENSTQSSNRLYLYIEINPKLSLLLSRMNGFKRKISFFNTYPRTNLSTNDSPFMNTKQDESTNIVLQTSKSGSIKRNRKYRSSTIRKTKSFKKVKSVIQSPRNGRHSTIFLAKKKISKRLYV